MAITSNKSDRDQIAFGMTLKEFIDYFGKGHESYHSPMIGLSNDGKPLDLEFIENHDYDAVNKAVAKDLNSFKLKEHVFLKNVPDKFLVPAVMSKIKSEYGDTELHFFTWVELDDHKGRTFSFWFFPVVTFQNNTTDELISNTLSVINFGRLVRKLYKEPDLQNSFGPCVTEDDKNCSVCGNEANVRITIVGYPDQFVENDKSEYLEYLKRKNQIIIDNIEEYSEDTEDGIPIKRICINECDNRFEQHLANTDLLVFQNGEIGNAIYRAWISTGLVKQAYTFVIHKESKEPLWVGKSTFDPIKDEESFAKACFGLKKILQEMNSAS